MVSNVEMSEVLVAGDNTYSAINLSVLKNGDMSNVCVKAAPTYYLCGCMVKYYPGENLMQERQGEATKMTYNPTNAKRTL